MNIVHDGARVESMDSSFRGKNLGLIPINKLEQLRKYIIYINVEIERIRLSQVFNSKVKFVEIDKSLSIQSVSRGNRAFI